MSLYLDAVLPDSPTILLMLDEASGTTFTDDSGNGHDGTSSGGALTYRATGPSGAIPFGLKFNNTGRITVADHADVNIGDGPATFEWFYKCSNPDITTRTICNKSDNTTNPGYQIFHHFPNRRFYFADGNGTGNILTSVIGETADASWHYYAVTRASGADGNWYRDSKVCTSASNTITFSDSPADLLIGDDPGSSHTDIYIAAFAIYKTALSAARIEVHCSVGFGDGLTGITKVGRV